MLWCHSWCFVQRLTSATDSLVKSYGASNATATGNYESEEEIKRILYHKWWLCAQQQRKNVFVGWGLWSKKLRTGKKEEINDSKSYFAIFETGRKERERTETLKLNKRQFFWGKRDSTFICNKKGRFKIAFSILPSSGTLRSDRAFIT